MTHQIVTEKGKRFVMVPVAEWRRMERITAQANAPVEKLPALPKADADGNVPALAYLQASIARDILRERKALELTQAELAARAGLRVETLSRLESGKHSPTVRTVEKIDQVLREAAASTRKAK